MGGPRTIQTLNRKHHTVAIQTIKAEFRGLRMPSLTARTNVNGVAAPGTILHAVAANSPNMAHVTIPPHSIIIITPVVAEHAR